MRRVDWRLRAAVLAPGWLLAQKRGCSRLRLGKQGIRGAVLSPDCSPSACWTAARAGAGSLSHLCFPTPVPARGTNMHSRTPAPQTATHTGSLNDKRQCSFPHAPSSDLTLPCFPSPGLSCCTFAGEKGSWILHPSLLPLSLCIPSSVQ